jgi:hypothetical protein
MAGYGFIPLKKVQFELLKHNQALEKYYQQKCNKGTFSLTQKKCCMLYDKAIVLDLADVIAGKQASKYVYRQQAYNHFCDKLELYRVSVPLIIHSGKATQEQITFRLACLDQVKTIIQDILYTGAYYPAKPGVQVSLLPLMSEIKINRTI